MIDDLELHHRALAEAFDSSFAAPVVADRPASADFLVLRLGGKWFAVPVAELSAVQKRRTISALPDAPRHCLGVAGVRGRPAAVYDLAAVLGVPPAPERMHWLLLSRRDPELAFAAPEAERYVRAPADAVVPAALPEGPYVAALVDAERSIPVLSVDQLVDAVAPSKGAA
jgi:chemotaxis signal transduction protein